MLLKGSILESKSFQRRIIAMSFKKMGKGLAYNMLGVAACSASELFDGIGTTALEIYKKLQDRRVNQCFWYVCL